MKKIILCFSLTLVLASCLRYEDLSLSIDSIIPIDIGDGTPISAPNVEGIDLLQLEKIYTDIKNDDRLWSIRSLLVYRNSNLISEHYFKDKRDRTQPQLMWSCTKQLLGVLCGIALEDGVIKDIDDAISAYFSEELMGHEDKSVITIRQLLTMKSGIDYENDGPFGETHKILLQKPDDIVDFILSQPMKYEVGTTFDYKDGDPQLLASLLEKVLRRPLDEWADEVLLSRIGVNNYEWARYKDGKTLGGFGLITTPRELGKIGLLVSQYGSHKNEQIISSDWIREMTAVQVARENKLNGFGYMWWINKELNAPYMWGHGGQFAFLIQEKNMVFVISSIPNTQGSQQIEPDEIIPYLKEIIELAN